ncbi:hypothetical protein AV540_20340 [Brevibacillus parabrevis]|nr:hypothetical protein AV540_20340 [Brevibacillus parabrevis]
MEAWRIAYGANRAPTRNEAAVSNGWPIIATLAFSLADGNRMNVPVVQNSGFTSGESGRLQQAGRFMRFCIIYAFLDRRLCISRYLHISLITRFVY